MVGLTPVANGKLAGYFSSVCPVYVLSVRTHAHSVNLNQRRTSSRCYLQVNHLPCGQLLSKKHILAEKMAHYHKLFPSAYNFAPETFVMPHQMEEFKKVSLSEPKVHRYQLSIPTRGYNNSIAIYHHAQKLHTSEHSHAHHRTSPPPNDTIRAFTQKIPRHIPVYHTQITHFPLPQSLPPRPPGS